VKSSANFWAANKISALAYGHIAEYTDAKKNDNSDATCMRYWLNGINGSLP
jgi:hypothetical protein